MWPGSEMSVAAIEISSGSPWNLSDYFAFVMWPGLEVTCIYRRDTTYTFHDTSSTYCYYDVTRSKNDLHLPLRLVENVRMIDQTYIHVLL
jgi:hypothetical protein